MNHGPDIHARLTPAMRLLVERMAKAPYPPLHTLSAAEAKAAHAKTHGVLDVPPPALPRVDNITVPARLGLDATRLAVGGDSAGGTLAAVSAIHARDAGLRLALQLLIYPGTTDHQDTDSHAEFAHGPVLDKQLIDWFFHHYIDSVDRSDWRFAPLRHDDVEGVAPAWIGLAECDPLVDEGVHYADKLRAAGVPVALEIYRGVVHGFITMARSIPEALQLREAAGAALRAAFAR